MHRQCQHYEISVCQVDRPFGTECAPKRLSGLVVIRMDHPAWLAIGRAIFGGHFVWSGINHFMQTTMMAGYAASKGMPSIPSRARMTSATS